MLPVSYLKYFLYVCDVGNITETLKEQIFRIDSDASVVVRFVDVNNVWTRLFIVTLMSNAEV